MAVFAKYLTDSNSWYIDALKKKALVDAAKTEGWLDDILSYMNYHIDTIRLLGVFLLYLLFGSLWVAYQYDFSIINSLFFSISALAGGGRLAIPDGAPDSHYAIIGIYVCTGIPVMAIATGVIAHAIVFSNESDDSLRQKMQARLTETELELMKIFGIDDGNGDIDPKEFVVLTLVRIGALEPELIKMIFGLYDSLAEDSKGVITYETLQQMSISRGTSRKSFGGKSDSRMSINTSRKSLIDKNAERLSLRKIGTEPVNKDVDGNRNDVEVVEIV